MHQGLLAKRTGHYLKVQSCIHPVNIETMKLVVTFTIFFLWNIQSSLAQTASAGSMKIYITWIKIKAEKEKKIKLNFDISDSAILLPCKYKKTDYLSGRFDFSEANARNISIVQIRNSPGAGGDALADDFIVDLYVGKNGNHTGFSNQNPCFDGVNDLQSFVIDGMAVVAGSILLAALSGTTGNADLHVPKAHVHRKEPPPTKNMANMNFLSLNGLQVNGNHNGFSFVPLRDTVVDFDGNVYHTSALGGMVIMAEDLMVTHFHNGKEIPNRKDSTDLSAVNIPAYCNYGSDSGIPPGNGMLYNWHAVSDTSRICPKNWHIPSNSEWISLINCLGGTQGAAGKLMENFSSGGKVCNWWSSTGQDNGHAQSLYLDLKAMEVKLMGTNGNSGLPVRCMKDY
jgi:Fibrobacter succinogenes major domain (Fib_succ_major)